MGRAFQKLVPTTSLGSFPVSMQKKGVKYLLCLKKCKTSLILISLQRLFSSLHSSDSCLHFLNLNFSAHASLTPIPIAKTVFAKVTGDSH